MALSLMACAPGQQGGEETETTEGTKAPEKLVYKVAMVTGYGDITDRACNQTTWEAVAKFGQDNQIDTGYYKPATDDTQGRIAAVEQAVAEGYNVIVLPGKAFSGVIAAVSGKYPAVKFVALDVSRGDLLESGVALKGGLYDNNPTNWDLSKYVYMENVYCAAYKEELAGFMAGYAAVKLGYTSLGFLGSVAIEAVQRYGYGYVQGIDAAAKALNSSVELKYVYAGQSFSDADIAAVMDSWYSGGTRIVFACGGDLYTAAAEAAKKAGGKVIGADTDQAAVIDSLYGEGVTVTSAMKGFAPAVTDTLTDILMNGKWADYAGRTYALGLVSGENAALNYVQLPLAATQFAEGKFTQSDYAALVKALFDGTLKVSDKTAAFPATTNVAVTDLGSIKVQA